MDRVVFVLGAAGGVVGALCERLRAEGARLALCARDAPRLRARATELGASAHPLDPASFDGVDAAVDAAAAEHGRLDGIVCCAGSLLCEPAVRDGEATWRDVVAADLDGAFAAVRAGARALGRSGGAIVLVASPAAPVRPADREAITAARAGVIGFGLAAAAAYAPRQVRVNVVAPGLARASRPRRLYADAPGGAPARPLRGPDDAVRAVAWLLHPDQAWVTGQVVDVDAGVAAAPPR